MFLCYFPKFFNVLGMSKKGNVACVTLFDI